MDKHKNNIDPNSPESKEKDGRNLEEMGADQYDYGIGGPGAGRDDSSLKSEEDANDKKGTKGSDLDTGSGVGSST